jgi:hypothetical protein
MINDFGRQHPGISLVIIAVLLMINAWLDYAACLRPVAYAGWFLGGLICAVALSCCIGGYFLLFGIFRWPVAAAVFIAGIYALWRFRPKDRNRQ